MSVISKDTHWVFISSCMSARYQNECVCYTTTGAIKTTLRCRKLSRDPATAETTVWLCDRVGERCTTTDRTVTREHGLYRWDETASLATIDCCLSRLASDRCTSVSMHCSPALGNQRTLLLDRAVGRSCWNGEFSSSPSSFSLSARHRHRPQLRIRAAPASAVRRQMCVE